MSCTYQIWDKEAEEVPTYFGDSRNLNRLKGTVVGSGALIPCDGKETGRSSFCPEHEAFHQNAEEKGVLMQKDGKMILIHPKAIKELFPKQKKPRKKKTCPHCGGIL